MHHDRSIDHPIVVLRFADLPQFLNTLNWKNLSFHHTRKCTESVALGQVLALPWAAPLLNWTTRLSDFGLVSSVVSIRLLFVFVSPSVFFHQFHTSSSTFLQSTRHLLAVNLFPLRNIARVHPPRSSDLANSFLKYRWTGSSPKPCCMVVPHVLFADDESRGDSICQFVCFLFHVIELYFDNFFFSSTIFLWSSTQTIESSRFRLTASSCPILPETFCQVLRKDKHKESKSEEGERGHREMMISIQTHYCCPT